MIELLALIATYFGVILQASPALDAPHATFAPPALVATLDGGQLKGEPAQLGWSVDGSTLFVQVSERASTGIVKSTHVYTLSPAEPKPVAVSAMPAWAADYWQWKSGKTASGTASPEIEITQQERASTGTEAPMGGSIGRTGDPRNAQTVDDVSMRAQQMQQQQVITLTLKGEKVGEFVNQPFLPGYTFGWGPPALGAIAYVNGTGHLAIMDMKGGRQELPASKAVILPAWSMDGSSIAYLQKAGRKKYELYVVKISS